MVQIHKNKSGELSELLGMSLGSGLAGLTNDYYADKAIKGVMEDPSLKNAPIEERQSKLALALRPFGARGQQTLENLVGIEEKGEARKAAETKRKTEEKERATKEAAYKELGIPAGTPDSVAAALTKEKEKQKGFNAALDYLNKRNKTPITPGGEINTGEDLNGERPMENWSTKDIFEAKAVPNKLINDIADTELDYRKHLSGEAKSDRDYQLKVDERHAKFDEELNKQHSNSAKERIALNQIEKSVNSGDIGPNTLTNFAQNTLKGTWLEHAFDSKESSNFQAALPQLLGGFESIFKRGLTDRDLKLILDKLPSIGKTKEANLASVQFLRKILDLNDKKFAIAQEIKKENKGFKKIDYVDEIERRDEERYGNEINRLFADSTDSVRMIAPDGGKMTVPREDVQKMLDLEARIIND
jgi:hypothetical protein